MENFKAEFHGDLILGMETTRKRFKSTKAINHVSLPRNIKYGIQQKISVLHVSANTFRGQSSLSCSKD